MDRNQVPRHESEHLSADTLAELAEDPRAAVDKRHLAHLAHCRSCMAAYADAVRYRTAWLGSPEMFEETEDEPVKTPPPARKTGLPQLPLAAGLLLVVGIGAWVTFQREAPTPKPSGPIAELLERASGTGLVLPGGERGAAEPVTPFRGTPQDREVDTALEELRVRYENGSRSIDDLYTLAAALTAAGRVDLAHDYVEEGRARAPQDPGFLLLVAALEREDGALDQAERLLRKARALSQGDVTLMLDHAIVLAELHNWEEAEVLLREVIRRAPGSPLAARAEALRRSFAVH